MRYSESWLREWVNPELSSDQIGEQLTMAGLELEGLEKAAGTISKVVVGEVLSCSRHPQADRLTLCEVQVSEGEENLQIVCGASNVAEGIKVPVALIGAKLSGGFKIKKSKLRGIESFGMLCGASELGLEESSDGLMLLPKDAPVGENINHYLQLDDSILEIDLTPNRGDCLSIKGLAREISVLNKIKVMPPSFTAVKPKLSDACKVELKETEACPKYLGRIIRAVDVGVPTPLWMSERLRRCGVRPIDLVVDVTNYVLLECGQPMHAFDLDKLSGQIEVRMSTKGEKLTLLDGQEVTLSSNTLVIADSKKALAVFLKRLAAPRFVFIFGIVYLRM